MLYLVALPLYNNFGQIVGYRKLIYSPINWDFTLISQLLLLLSLRNLLTGSYSAQWSVNKKELHKIGSGTLAGASVPRGLVVLGG